MKYLVCKKQHGEGCDYTIGCGMRFDFIEASSIEDVLLKIVYPDGKDERSALEGDNALSDILIIQSEHVTTVDVGAMLKVIKQQRVLELAGSSKAKELAELERLKKKYGA